MIRLRLHPFAVFLGYWFALAALPAGSALAQSSAVLKPDQVTSFHQPAALPEYGSRIGEERRGREDRIFDYFADRVLSEHFQYSPESATSAGVHDFDTLLTQTSAEGIAARGSFAASFLGHLSLVSEADLTPARRIDHQLLVNRLNAWMFEYEHERPWESEPSHFVGIVSNGVQSLLRRNFAPLDDRVRSLAARLAQVPRVFADARLHLKAPSRVHTEVAIEQAKGLVIYLEGAVVEQARAASPAARAAFDARHPAAVQAAKDYAAWLESEVLPKSTADFALGETRFRQKLLYEEMIETDLDEILSRAHAALDETRAEMEKAAAEISPGLSVQDALRQIDAKSPAEDKLIEATRKELAAIRAFLEKQPVMAIPQSENLLVEFTPPFRRSTSFASMSSPGVLEKNADEAYYYITPPDAAWTAERKREFLTMFNPYSLRNVSVHEAYPGHYYQFLSLRRCASTLRALLGSRTNSEGWAHYCEQMMIEQGLGKDDPRYRLAQLRAASVRLCRLIASISLHARGMSLEAAQKLFEEKGYLPAVNAAREARRGVVDPTYGAYTLGKWQILDMRREFERQIGKDFQLRDFHDRFLAQGRAPLPLVRQALLASLPAPGLRRSP